MSKLTKKKWVKAEFQGQVILYGVTTVLQLQYALNKLNNDAVIDGLLFNKKRPAILVHVRSTDNLEEEEEDEVDDEESEDDEPINPDCDCGDHDCESCYPKGREGRTRKKRR